MTWLGSRAPGVVLLTSGAGLMGLAFIVDWMGISGSSFGRSQALAYIGGVWLLVIGWSTIRNELFPVVIRRIP